MMPTMDEGERRASPAEMLLSGVSLACWLAAIAFLIADAAGSSLPALRGMARASGPAVGFTLPLAVGSQALLALRRPARGPAWRGFQVGMLVLSGLTLALAVWKYAL
jgi:hypothetical protein